MRETPIPRAGGDHATTSIWATWPVQDIVYVGIIGSIMLAALLEWVLWLLAFLYCMVKVYQKADGEGRWSIRTLAVLNMAFFIAMRCIFLPIMVVTLPLPAQVVHYFPQKMISILQWFAFWSFAGLLTIPWLFCVYQLVTHNVGRARRIKTVLDEHSAPKVVIIMPCYHEEPEVLLRTVDSIVDCDYPPSCMHIFLSFDGDKEDELYLNTIDRLGVPITLASYPRSIDVAYRGCRITVSRFAHGGKRSCQKKSFKLIDKVYADYLRRNDDLFLLFIDSDCILDKNCIQNFMYEMELKPGSKHSMLAMTGVITSTTAKNSLITMLQDMEYIHGQLFERAVESGCGAVTCLPGALTMLRFSAFRKMSRFYFADKAEQCDDLFDYGKCHLGEDRWLTHLFMIGAKERYQIQMNTSAFCKTEAVQTFKSLLKQRRRWFLGFITNEVCMLTDIRLWRRYPLLLLIRLAQNTIRTTALLFFIMVISILTTSQKVANLPVGFIAVSLGLNWLLMLYFGAKLGRYKLMLYPIMFVLNPFMNWLYMVYAIFTCGQRTWGGPRVDAGKADSHTTPSQAVSQAEKTGDELNVVPETFKPAIVSALHHRLPRSQHYPTAPLLPSGHLEGRFAPAEQLPGGWYRQTNDSGALHADMTPRRVEEARWRQRSLGRDSIESTLSGISTSDSVQVPRRVESLFAPEDAAAYFDRQAVQRPAGGAYFEQAAVVWDGMPRVLQTRHNERPRSMTKEDHRGGSTSDISIHSLGSEESVPMHFDISPAGGAYRLPDITTPARNQISAYPIIGPVVPPAAHLSMLRGQNVNTNSEGATFRQAAASKTAAKRTGKSPLARKSFTRLMSPPLSHQDAYSGIMGPAEVIELERLAAAQARARRESQEADGTARRGRTSRRQSEEVSMQGVRGSGRQSGSRRPRKLSKRRKDDGPGGRSRDSNMG